MRYLKTSRLLRCFRYYCVLKRDINCLDPLFLIFIFGSIRDGMMEIELSKKKEKKQVEKRRSSSMFLIKLSSYFPH